jgi:hypothetical protein
LGIFTDLGSFPFSWSFNICSFMMSSPGRGGGAFVAAVPPGTSEEPPQPAIRRDRKDTPTRQPSDRLTTDLLRPAKAPGT